MAICRAIPMFLPAALLIGTAACGPTVAAPESGLVVPVFDGATMGTTYTVRVVSADDREHAWRQRIGERIQAALDAVESAMSTYEPVSELSRFNDARTTEPFQVSPATFEVVRQAQAISELTGGALDVTIGPLVDAWGFGPDEPAAFPPDDDLISRIRDRIGFSKLVLDAGASTLRKTDPELECDLSAVAKGYAVDQVARTLAELGVTRYMVEVGGEIVAAGLNPQGRPWRIGIERPSEEGGVERVVPLTGKAMATSGDYHNVREANGRLFSHTIDPRTGQPVEHRLASVTVIADECVVADGLATALMVLGPEQGYALAVEQGWAALFLSRDDVGGLTARATTVFEELVMSGPS